MGDGGGDGVVSASDLVGHLACGYLTQLERAVVAGKAKRPFRNDPGLAVLVERGREHEAGILRRSPGREERSPRSRSIGPAGRSALAGAVAQTEEAMRRGDAIIYQAALVGDGIRGHADFLVRIEQPSDLGAWSYEPHDTKLARTAKAGHLMQLCVYAERIAAVQGRMAVGRHGNPRPAE